MRRILLLALTLSIFQPCFSQDTTTHSIPLKKVKLYGGIGYTTGMLVLSQAWYAENGLEHFKFFNDNAEWLQVDKFGHTYGTYQFSRINYELLKRTELSNDKALLWSSFLSTALFLPIEILDGFSPDYGFSYGDMIANAAGSGLFYVQQKHWNEQRIKLKFSFRSTSYPDLRPNTLGKNFPEQLLKDYNGQSYWFSFDMHAFAKESSWPKWINLAVGYGAEGMVYSRSGENESAGYSNYRKLFFGVDFDLSYIETSSRFLKTTLFILDMIKLPSPVIQIDKNGVSGHLFYY